MGRLLASTITVKLVEPFHFWWGSFLFLCFNFWWSSTSGVALFHTAFSFCPVVGDLFLLLLCSCATPVRCGGALFVGHRPFAQNHSSWFGLVNPHAKHLMMTDDDVADDHYTNDSCYAADLAFATQQHDCVLPHVLRTYVRLLYHFVSFPHFTLY
ncbi:unnamed protein product [Heterosigma akashiwo]